GAGQLNAGIQKLNGSINGKNGLSSGVSTLVKGGNDLNNAFNGKVLAPNGEETNLVESADQRSEERRVGKGWRCRWWTGEREGRGERGRDGDREVNGTDT